MNVNFKNVQQRQYEYPYLEIEGYFYSKLIDNGNTLTLS